MSGTLRYMTAYSAEPSIPWESSTTLPATRSTNSSPSPRLNTSSGATRESAQVRTTARGLCPLASSRRRAGPVSCLTTLSPTKRALPSLRRWRAASGVSGFSWLGSAACWRPDRCRRAADPRRGVGVRGVDLLSIGRLPEQGVGRILPHNAARSDPPTVVECKSRPFHVCVFGINAYTGLHKEANHGTLLDGFAYSNRPRVSCPPGIPSGPRRMLPGVGTLGAKLVAPATRNGVHRTVASWRWP